MSSPADLEIPFQMHERKVQDRKRVIRKLRKQIGEKTDENNNLDIQLEELSLQVAERTNIDEANGRLDDFDSVDKELLNHHHSFTFDTALAQYTSIWKWLSEFPLSYNKDTYIGKGKLEKKLSEVFIPMYILIRLNIHKISRDVLNVIWVPEVEVYQNSSRSRPAQSQEWKYQNKFYVYWFFLFGIHMYLPNGEHLVPPWYALEKKVVWR